VATDQMLLDCPNSVKTIREKSVARVELAGALQCALRACGKFAIHIPQAQPLLRRPSSCWPTHSRDQSEAVVTRALRVPFCNREIARRCGNGRLREYRWLMRARVTTQSAASCSGSTRPRQPCSTTNRAVEIGYTPFLFYMLPGMAFRLRGRARDSALILAGATLWTPYGEPPGNSPWVLVPVVHFLRWDRLAIEAMRYATEGNVRAPVAVPNQGPPPEPPAALRWRDNIKALLEKASNLRLR